MAKLIQPSANREGQSDEMSPNRLVFERRRELFVFQHFFRSVLRELPGA